MIKVENRNFIIPTDERVIGVVGENAATTVVFEIDRFIGDMDLSKLACFLDIYPIDKSKRAYNDVISTEILETTIKISWVVLSHDLINSGKLWFNLRFVEIKEDIVDSQDYAVYITNKDYFVIWEDARQHNNEILTPNDLQSQMLAQTTEQANIAIRQAKISTEALTQMEYERELAQQAVDDANAQVELATTKASEAEASATIATNKATEILGKAEIATEKATIATTQAGIATTKASEALESATSAEESNQSAIAKATIATTKAEEALESATSASTSASNANTYKTQAQASATSASTSAGEASASATTSTQQATISTNKATESSNSATLSKSWAVGGTNTRTGEETNNAKYWCEQAEQAVGGDFVTPTEMQEYAEPKITSKGTAFNKDFGTGENNVARGNHTHDFSSLELGETSTTAYRGDRGKTAYDHSQSTHAPTDAQKNSDITKEEIEAKLTGTIITHNHNEVYEPVIATKNTAFNKNFGTVAGTVAEGDKYLPLDNSKQMDSQLSYKSRASIFSPISDCSISIYTYNNDNTSNCRALQLFPKTAISDISSAFRFEEMLNGVRNNYRIYGEHNKDIMPFAPKSDSTLTTTNKTIVGAINEVNTKATNATTGGWELLKTMTTKNLADLLNFNNGKDTEWDISVTNFTKNYTMLKLEIVLTNAKTSATASNFSSRLALGSNAITNDFLYNASPFSGTLNLIFLPNYTDFFSSPPSTYSCNISSGSSYKQVYNKYLYFDYLGSQFAQGTISAKLYGRM